MMTPLIAAVFAIVVLAVFAAVSLTMFVMGMV